MWRKQILLHIYTDIIPHFYRVMSKGYLKVFNANCTWKNFLVYWTTAHNLSVDKKFNKMKMQKKEEWNCFVILLSLRLSKSMLQIFLAPQCKGSLLAIDVIPINLMTSTTLGTDLDCTFCTVIVISLVHPWELWISFCICDLALHENNIKSCFQQFKSIKHHPNIMDAFLFIIALALSTCCSVDSG